MDIFVDIGGVVESNAFEALDVGGKVVKFGESSAALLLDADFDLADPSTLKLNTLRNDLFLQARNSDM